MTTVHTIPSRFDPALAAMPMAARPPQRADDVLSPSPLRTLLVHLDASSGGAGRLAFARGLATTHGAALRVLYAVTPMALMAPTLGADGLGAVMPLLIQMDADHRHAAHRLVERMLRDVPGVSWSELGPEPVAAGVARQAWTADLLIVGAPARDRAPAAGVPGDFVPSVVIGSGRPVIVLPAEGTHDGRIRRALVAWKPCREAARALAAALPLLQRAEEVHIVGDDAEGARPLSAALDLTDWLRAHGLDRQLHHHPALDGDVGEELLSLAADVDADLIVMGCYGHGRAREWALGGVTRTVLRSLGRPVLMAH